MGSVRIVEVKEGELGREFDQFVQSRAEVPTDLPGWRHVVRQAYGLPSYRLAALEGDRVVGALTLFEAKHPLFGHYLATAGFGTDGGFHSDQPSATQALQRAATELADRLNVEFLVLRGRGRELDGLRHDHTYRTAVIDLTGGAKAFWEALPSKTRNHIRKGQKESFTVSAGPEEMPAFFEVFHTHMRDLGSPAHSLRFYEAIAEHLGECSEFIVVRDADKLVAGALLFRINGTASNLHTVALKEFNRRCPNYLIYWQMIESSVDQGCTRFDLGRSEVDSQTLQFKLNWRPEVITLNYDYYLRKLEETPGLNPGNPKYRMAISAWKKMPVFLSRRVGPRLISGLL